MSPFIDQKASWIAFFRRFRLDKVIQPFTMGVVVLVFAAGVSNGMTKVPPTVKPQPSESQSVISPLPLPTQARVRLRHRRLTEALMTSHYLTAAHVFSPKSSGKLSAETREMSKRG